MKQQDRDALKFWEEYKEAIKHSTPVDITMSSADIAKHREELEANDEEWIKFFFPKYAQYDFAEFQLDGLGRVINTPELYEVWSWARELAKSTCAIFAIMKLTLTAIRKKVICISSTEDNAIRLLAPFRANLEANGRIKQYYGEQVTYGSWTETEFITRGGVAFRALGFGNPPRGSRNENIRPDILYFDDFDTDKDCLNPETIIKKWEWCEKAVYPTRSVSEPTLILWCGNIIEEDTCVGRAAKMADHHMVINLRMVNIKKPQPQKDFDEGVSVWLAKNSEAHIDRVFSTMSKKAIMGEYFNHPLREGDLLKIKYGKIPPLENFPFLVAYGDPTQSEAKGPTKNKKGSRKAVWLVGQIGSTIYVIRGFLGKMTNYEFITCFFVLYEWVKGKVPVYCYVENNGLQNPFYDQVFKPHAAAVREERGTNISVTPDTSRKPDKAVRIEAALEPLSREGRLIVNKEEK
ncbi:MAG: hypothetical protein LUF68_05390 [Clostridiales bacterium]|nr:hypothetical protein [Clostridiales bacterium]